VTFPSSQLAVPAVVGRLAAGRSVHAVWVNEEGGVTFRVGSDMPGRVWDVEFFAAYKVEPDPTRVGYYRRLWQAEDITSR
jgi:aminoglycoside phosphotransferase